MKIILHVGTEKTGSTSIQAVCGDNRKRLLEKGWLFPETSKAYSHVNLTVCALEGAPDHPVRQLYNLGEEKKWSDFRDNVLSSLENQIHVHDPDLLLLSDEHLSGHINNIDQLFNYKKIIERYGSVSSVIIYLRRQDSLRLSLFSEAVKVGNLKNFDIYNPLPIFDDIPFRFNYIKMLDNFSEVFGSEKLILRIFDRKDLFCGNVVSDFVKISGVPITVNTDISREENRSIDARIIKNVAKISMYLKQKNNKMADTLRIIIINLLQRTFNGPGPVMKECVHNKFMEQFESQNNIIKERYFPNLNRTELFRPITIDEVCCYPECSFSWQKMILECVKCMILT